MSSYIKIHSRVKIDEEKLPTTTAQFIFDYDRQEDDEDEKYRYEYFLELSCEDEEDEQLVAEFHNDCRAVLTFLNERIGADNYYITNMSGIYLP
jgi:hypothetical protein